MRGNANSVYVTAATEEKRDPKIIQKYLNQADYTVKNQEHHDALCEAIAGNDFEIVKMITDKANATDGTAINPYKLPDSSFKKTLANIVDNMFRHVKDPALIAHMLQQKPIQRYLRSMSKNSYSFTPLDTMITSSKISRPIFELLNVLANGRAARLEPVSSSLKFFENKCAPKQREVLFAFTKLTSHVNDGLLIKTKHTTKKLPGLPLAAIHRIYDYAIGYNDLLDLPVTKGQILRIAEEKKVANKNVTSKTKLA